MIDMESGQLTIYAQWAAIVGVPISIIGLIIAFLNLKSQSRRIKNNETKITGIIVDRISQQTRYYSGSNQNFYNINVFPFAFHPDHIKNSFKDS